MRQHWLGVLYGVAVVLLASVLLIVLICLLIEAVR